MKLGVLLPIGSSLANLRKTGQETRFLKYYLENYSRAFDRTAVFSYERESHRLLKNAFLIPNENKEHRFIYSFLMPFVHRRIIKAIDVFRVMQLSGCLPAILIKIFFKKPFFATYGYDYSAFAMLEGRYLRAGMLKILEKICFKLATGVFVTNIKTKKKLKQKYPQARLIYLPNGVNLKKFKPKTPKLKISRKDEINILTVARLVKQKNLDNLIKAAALLKNKYKLRLVFIGEGKLRLQLIELAKKEGVKLKVIKRVMHQRLVSFYHQADIFCLPSYQEGQPKALLEAMACGLPCLIGDYEGAREFKNRLELLITGFKVKEINLNLEKLLKDFELQKKLSQNGRKRIERDFEIEKILAKEIKILKAGSI